MSTDFLAANYCVSWLDLLGTRERYKGQGLIPKTLEEQVLFRKVVDDTVGRIDQLQERAVGLLANTASDGAPPIESMAFGDSILHYASVRGYLQAHIQPADPATMNSAQAKFARKCQILIGCDTDRIKLCAGAIGEISGC